MTLGEALRVKMAKAPRFKSLYHFTDASNLPSIRSHGLLSKAELDNKAIEYRPSGSPQSHVSDRKSGVYGWVSLSFTSEHPMSYIAQQDGRIENVVWLKIDPMVLDSRRSYFCPVMANRNDAELHEFTRYVEQGKFDGDILYSFLDWKDPEVRKRLDVVKKYELLIEDNVPPEFISVL